MKNIVIGIEGMVGAGKTSICNELLNFVPNSIFIDGSKIYRGLVEALHQSNIDMSKLNDVLNLTPFELLRKLNVEFKIEDRKTVIYINGNKVSDDTMKSMQNSVGVSKMANMADNTKLFTFAYHIVEEYSKKYNLIVSARDLVKIYPEMDLHIFITASLDERVKRRYNQLDKKYTIDEVRNTVIQRDILHEKSGFNEISDKTVKIDVTQDSSANESAKKIYEKYIKQLIEK